MSNENILFVVEGKVAEPALVNKLAQIFNLEINCEFYCYKNPIYELIDKIHNDLLGDDYLDVILLLKEYAVTKEDKKTLSKKYSAIYFIFDFDPHYQKFDIDKIIKFQNYFDESIDQGLLLINYPMIECFKHINKFPDANFLCRTVSKAEIKRYKEIVGNESKHTNLDKYHYNLVINMIVYHIIKLNYLITGEKQVPNRETLRNQIINLEFIKSQFDNYNNDSLFVVSTLYYFVIELKDTTLFDQFKGIKFEEFIE